MNFIITKWHEENPNDWCALEMTDKPKKGWGQDPNKYILRGRAATLEELSKLLPKGHGYTYCTAWGHGISKDMLIGESSDEYYRRKGL